MLLSNTAAAGAVLTPWSFCVGVFSIVPFWSLSFWTIGYKQLQPQYGHLTRRCSHSVCLSSDLCKCSERLFFPPPYSCAFPQRETPAPKTAQCHWLSVPLPWVPALWPTLNPSCGAGCRRASAGFFTCIRWSCETRFYKARCSPVSGYVHAGKNQRAAVCRPQPRHRLWHPARPCVCPLSVHRPRCTSCSGTRATRSRVV